MSKKRWAPPGRVETGYERAYLVRVYRCHYCGGRANGVDHCPPRSWNHIVNLDVPRTIVECCSRCNSALGTKPILLLEERLKFIKDLLELKNAGR